jgi:hypothetical protein
MVCDGLWWTWRLRHRLVLDCLDACDLPSQGGHLAKLFVFSYFQLLEMELSQGSGLSSYFCLLVKGAEGALYQRWCLRLG